MRVLFSFLFVIGCSVAAAQKKQASKSVYLEDISWVEAAKVLTPSSVVVIPLGAASKEHGPHLPLSADRIQAEYFKEQIALLDSVVIAPTITYAYYPPFLKYAGSTSVRLSTGKDMLVEIVRSLAGYGPRRFYVINLGLTTNATLDLAAKLLREDGIVLGYLDYLRPSYEAIDDHIKVQATGTHADEMETSNLLLMRPQAVDMKKAVDDTSAKVRTGPSISPVKAPNTTYSASGVFGYASLATKEKGRRSANAYIVHMMKDIDSVRNCPLPAIPDHTGAYAEFLGTYTYGDGKKLVISLSDNQLQYVIDGRSMIGSYPLLPYGNDRFCSQMLDLLFLRNEGNQVQKAWCYNVNGQFWAIKEK